MHVAFTLRRAAGARAPARRSSRASRTSSARAWRRAPSTSATAGRARPSTGRPASGPARRTCSSRSTPTDDEHLRAAPATELRGVGRAAGASTLGPRAARRGAAGRARPLRLLRRDRPARRGGRRRAPAPGRRPARRRRAAGATSGTGEFLLGYVDEDGTLPAAPRRPSTATARTSSTASCTWTSRRSGATSRRPGAIPGRPGAARGQDRRALARRHAARSARPSAPTRRWPTTRPRSTTSATPTTPTACAARSARTSAAPTRATPSGFFDGRLTNRHRIIRRGRPYGPPLPDGRDRGRRRRPRPGLRLLQRQHLAPVRDHPGALDRRRRPLRARRRQGLPRRRAARRPRAR